MPRFLGVLGRSFLVQNLYGSRYAPHIGTFSLPVVYIKAMLYSAAGDQVNEPERQYVQGFLDVIFPTSDQHEYENKIELKQIVDAYQTAGSRQYVSYPSPTLSSDAASTTPSPPPAKQKIESVSSFLSGSMMTNPVLARILLYDSIRTAAEDGTYSQAEQENAAKVSKQLGIPEVVTNRIEAIAAAEVKLAHRKRRLLLHGSNPSGSDSAGES